MNQRHTKAATLRYVPNRYIVFLQDPPVSARYQAREAMATTEALAYKTQIVSRQQSVVTALAGRNIQVTGAVNTLLNAVFVVATPDRLAEIRALPGVIGVMPERAMKKSLNKATALANAPAAWAQSSIGGQSNAGHGIKIAILDTGIDQTHPAFQDSTLQTPSGFPKCNAASDCANFTNNKVIVARSYVPQIAAQAVCVKPTIAGCQMATNPTPNPATSSPDDYSARDRDGHGSAVASAAAGEQNSGGSIAFSGMAPKAYLGSYKIYGSDGVNDYPPESVWIQAIEDVLNDGMNVANLSSGGPAYTGATDTTQCGNPAGVPCDPLASAFEAAAQAGLVITVSAGNSGQNAPQYPYFGSVASPSTAPSVISVGATLNSHMLGASVTVNASNAPSGLVAIPANRSDGYFGYSVLTGGCCTSPGLTAQVVDVTTAGDADGFLCSAPTGSLYGKIALIQDGGSCAGNYDLKTTNAANAGAAGAILYMAGAGTLIIPEGLLTYWFGPVVMISQSSGVALKTYVDANPTALVTIDTAGQEQPVSIFNQLASFSSLGPTPDGKIKPDMVATGGYDGYLGSADPTDPYLPSPNGMYVAGQNYDPNGELYSQTRYLGADGTSFSAPLVAGAAALVMQAHPTWSGAQIKSALLNNSAQDVAVEDYYNLPVDVESIGAGRLDANAAVTATVTAVPSTLSFGFLKSGVALPSPISVTVTNLGASSVTLAVAAATGVAATGATVSVNQSSVTLGAAGSSTASTTLVVTLAGAVPVSGEYNGAITLKSTSPAVNMRIPYMFIVGDGVVLNALSIAGDLYGAVGSDLGPVGIQVTDDYGAPVAGAPVTFASTPRGYVTLKSVTGVAGNASNNAEPFTPPACTPASGTTVTCPTDNYGVAWVDVVAGSQVTGSATVDFTASVGSYAGSNDLAYSVTLIPALTVTNSPSGGPPVEDASAYSGTVAPGSYAAIFGSNLLDPNFLINATGDLNTYSRLPMTLDGVTVSFDAPATGSLPAISEPGYIYFVSPGQVNLYVPWELENYPSAQVKVTFLEYIYSNLVNLTLANYWPAFLMNSGTVADALDNTTGALITTANPATAGEVLQLYCNGLGPVTNPPASGSPALATPLSLTTTPVTVSIGGKPALVYGGTGFLAPPYVGLYQVNIQVPSGLSSGNQPIAISVGGATSPAQVGGSTVSLPIK